MERPTTDGVLLVDKPAGVSSHDVVSVARRALRERRIGHAGTLDPFATGLLVLLVGRATRLLPYVDGEPKVYEATVRFGAATDTDDGTGVVVHEAPLPDPTRVREAIAQLTGTIAQRPPDYSAKQLGGTRAYAAARRGEALALPPVTVTVHEWRVDALEPDTLRATITCAGGTYIRALARDLGEHAGSAAHLVALRRTRSGHFDVGDAHPLDAVRDGQARLRPPRDAIPSLPVQPVDEAARARLTRGQRVPASVAGARAALVDASGELLAIGERSDDAWQPRVVLSHD
jgi:tRNA pseudouridine55 synthase